MFLRTFALMARISAVENYLAVSVHTHMHNTSETFLFGILQGFFFDCGGGGLHVFLLIKSAFHLGHTGWTRTAIQTGEL